MKLVNSKKSADGSMVRIKLASVAFAFGASSPQNSLACVAWGLT